MVSNTNQNENEELIKLIALEMFAVVSQDFRSKMGILR